MTLDEKLGQLSQMPGGRQKAQNSLIDDAERARISAGAVGSYLNVAGAAESRALQRIAVEESRLHIPLLFGLDVIHGYRTIFPVPLAMAASWDPAVPERAAHVAAAETAAARASTGPSRRWSTSPATRAGAGSSKARARIPSSARRWPRRRCAAIRARSLAGRDTILATVKHFAAYGAATGGRDYDAADMSERTPRGSLSAAFLRRGEGGRGLVHDRLQRRSAACRRPPIAPCSAARLARRAGAGRAWSSATGRRSPSYATTASPAAMPRPAALALDAGIDMDMSAGIYAERARRQRWSAIRGCCAELDEAVRRVLTAKERLGLFDDPYRGARSGARAAGRSCPTPTAPRRARRRALDRPAQE